MITLQIPRLEDRHAATGYPVRGEATDALRQAVDDLATAADRWGVPLVPALRGLRQVGHLAIDCDTKRYHGPSGVRAVAAWREVALGRLLAARLALTDDRERGRA